MDIKCKKIAKEVKKIHVQIFENEDVAVENKSSLEIIGKGRQGAVFKINENACVKVYGEIEDCEREYYALKLGKDKDLLPKVYCKGKNFVVMEMVYGVDLREYLQSVPLTKELSYKLIQMLITFKKIGFERIDHHKRQIYLQEDGSLKVIDVGRTVWRDRTYPYPRKLLQSLGDEYKALFLEHVKELAPDLYNEWQYYMHMEETARQFFHLLQEKKDINLEELSKQSDTLLTTIDSKIHYNKLLGLVRKVVKEEREREEIILEEKRKLEKKTSQEDQKLMQADESIGESLDESKEEQKLLEKKEPSPKEKSSRVKIIIEDNKGWHPYIKITPK